MFGQHNRQVLSRLLDYDEAAVAALERDGVIGSEILATGD
jgi:hypothetical protein